MTPLHKGRFRLPPGLVILLALVSSAPSVRAQPSTLEPVEVEGQPLAANVTRLLDALQFLGAPLPEATAKSLRTAARARDARKIQQLLDPQVLLHVAINPE